MTNTLPHKARAERRIELPTGGFSVLFCPASSRARPASIRHYPLPHQHFGRRPRRGLCWWTLLLFGAAGDSRGTSTASGGCTRRRVCSAVRAGVERPGHGDEPVQLAPAHRQPTCACYSCPWMPHSDRINEDPGAAKHLLRRELPPRAMPIPGPLEQKIVRNTVRGVNFAADSFETTLHRCHGSDRATLNSSGTPNARDCMNGPSRAPSH